MNWKLNIIILVCSLFLTSCQTVGRRQNGRTQVGGPNGARLAEGSSVSTQKSADELAPRPELQPGELPNVAVILGPGGYKAFAHAGVLKAFVDNRVPIQRIVGIEWGALLAGMYALKSQVHDVEWKLYKLEQKDLPQNRSFFGVGGERDTIKVLDKFFHENLNNETIQAAKIKFSCPSSSLWTGTLVWQDRGELREALKRCLPFPPLFRIQSPWLAGSFYLKEVIRQLRSEGYNLIVFVNVLGSNQILKQEKAIENVELTLLWQELRRSLQEAAIDANEVVYVDTSAFALTDFSQRKDLVRAGELAGAKQVRVIAEKYGF